MATKKLLNEAAKKIDASSETRLTVMTFENGKRKSTYSGLGLFEAFTEMSLRLQDGLQTLLLDETGHRIAMRHELQIKGRVSYEKMLPYAVAFRTYDFYRIYRRDRPETNVSGLRTEAL